MWFLHRLGADDDELHADAQVSLDRRFIADAAADLDRQIGKSLGDLADHLGVDRATGECPVQIHQMQAARPGLDPAFGHGQRVVGEDRGVLHAALTQPHAFTILQVNRGYEQHNGFFQQRTCQRVNCPPSGGLSANLKFYGCHSAKLASSRNPACALFSGWNCTAKMLSRAIAEAKSKPYRVRPATSVSSAGCR